MHSIRRVRTKFIAIGHFCRILVIVISFAISNIVRLCFSLACFLPASNVVFFFYLLSFSSSFFYISVQNYFWFHLISAIIILTIYSIAGFNYGASHMILAIFSSGPSQDAGLWLHIQDIFYLISFRFTYISPRFLNWIAVQQGARCPILLLGMNILDSGQAPEWPGQWTTHMM